jgi:hypothetical protein
LTETNDLIHPGHFCRRQRRPLRGYNIAAGDVHIIARTHRHGVAREGAAHVSAVAAGIIRLDRRGREQATRSVLVFISCTAGFVGRLDAHITSGRCTERALGHDLRAPDADVVAADLRAHIFAAGERGAVHAAFADAVRTVGLVHQIRACQRADPVGGTAVIGPTDLLPEVLVDRPQADVAACGQIHVARSGDHGCIGRNVTASGQGDVLAADTGNLVDVGAAGHRIDHLVQRPERRARGYPALAAKRVGLIEVGAVDAVTAQRAIVTPLNRFYFYQQPPTIATI